MTNFERPVRKITSAFTRHRAELSILFQRDAISKCAHDIAFMHGAMSVARVLHILKRCPARLIAVRSRTIFRNVLDAQHVNPIIKEKQHWLTGSSF